MVWGHIVPPPPPPGFVGLKKKLPQAFMQWMENDFRNLTAKVWTNLDNPIKSYEFSKFWLISCMPSSQLAITVMSQQYNCLMELYTNFYKILNFSWKCIFPLLLYLGMLGLRWFCMHKIYDWTWSTGLSWYPRKLKNCEILCTKSMESCSLVTSQILAEFRLERATYKTLHN